MKLSIVTTLYNSAPYINEFYNRITAAAKKITDDYEIIIVNDGSPDSSLDVAVELHKKDKKVKIIDLSRNFGHHKAIKAGLVFSKGEYIFLIDSDLEEPPELLEIFWNEIQLDTNVDVCYGVQEKRKGNLFESYSGYLYYWLLRRVISSDYPPNTLTTRIMRREYVESILKYTEVEYDLWCLFMNAGYSQKPIVCEKLCKDTTSYSFLKKVKIATITITSLSFFPLILIFYSGLAIFLVAISYLVYIVLNYMFNQVPIGWSSILASIWFLGGLIILFIGIVGLYLSKIFIEVKRRPEYLVKKIYERQKAGSCIP